MKTLRVITGFIAIAFACFALAHDPALSGIQILERSQDTVVTVSTHLSRLEAAEHRKLTQSAADEVIQKRLALLLDGSLFQPTQPHVIFDQANDQVNWQAIYSNHPSTIEVVRRIYPEDPASRTIVTVLRNGKPAEETVLTDKHPSLTKESAKTNIFPEFIQQGVQHILSGLDHVLFVIGLLLLGGGVKSLLKIVTMFTLAHSITLSLAATGVCNPPSRWVEPIIALSIVAIAVENLRPHRETTGRDVRPYVAFGFGLVHGFGFAGALSEVGLPPHALALALAAFNIGVELGQALIIAAVAPLISLLQQRRPQVWRPVAWVGSVVIGMIGSYWVVTRLLER